MADTWSLPLDLLLASVAWLFVGLRLRAATRHCVRPADLEECARNMDIHCNALTTLIDDLSTPRLLLQVALEASEALSDKAKAMQLARWIIESGPAGSDSQRTSQALVLREVEVSSPALAGTFERCVIAGFVAAILRWPDTAALWRQVSSRLLSETRRGAAVAMEASHLAGGPASLRPDFVPA